MGFVFASDNDSSNNDNSFATKQGHSFNIMLMGVDRRADDVGRSDTLMVLTYNPNEQKAFFVLYLEILAYILRKMIMIKSIMLTLMVVMNLPKKQ